MDNPVLSKIVLEMVALKTEYKNISARPKTELRDERLSEIRDELIFYRMAISVLSA